VKRVAGKSNTPLPNTPAMAVNLSDPLLMLEREVLKAKLQVNDLATAWSDIDSNAFSYLPYATLRNHIDSLPEMDIASLLERTQDDSLRSLITELTVEPIRIDGEVSERYVASIIARLREVALSRAIAEIKSTLQRINPVEESERYNQIFGELVAKEAERRAQKELAIGDL
jgi:DNA primase